MKKITLLFFFALMGNLIFGQSYNTVGGLRLGTEFGITAKHRVANRTTVEGIIQNGLIDDEVIVTVLGAQHLKLLTRRLNMFMGAGVHKGWITNDNVVVKNPAGITLVGGLDFTIRKWNISYDYKPAINLTGGYRNISSQTAISLRYVFVPRDSKVKKFFKEKKWKVWKKKKKNTMIVLVL